MDNIHIIDVTPENLQVQTLFCVKNPKAPGFKQKKIWFNKRYEEGLRLKIIRDEHEKPLAFIEYIPADFAWRPVDAPGYMFIHCMFTYSNKDKNHGFGTMLIRECELDAKSLKMNGVTTMTSEGSWIANRQLFEKNGFSEVDRLGRFELMVKKFRLRSPVPKLIDWTLSLKTFNGWHLLYADQCPWHEKSVLALSETAKKYGIELHVKKMTTSDQAKKSPSGFGVFALINDGKLLEDHYISQTRFVNILNKELHQ